MRGTTYSVNPGINGVGLAVWYDKRLVAARYLPSEERDMLASVKYLATAVNLATLEHYQPFSTLVVEWPQVYTQGKLKGDPNDLLPLAAIDGAIAFALGMPVVRYLPREWKGQMPKPKKDSQWREYLVTRRLQENLSPDEFRLIPDLGALTHNVIDAVGIGAHHLGRFKPRRVYAR